MTIFLPHHIHYCSVFVNSSIQRNSDNKQLQYMMHIFQIKLLYANADWYAHIHSTHTTPKKLRWWCWARNARRAGCLTHHPTPSAKCISMLWWRCLKKLTQCQKWATWEEWWTMDGDRNKYPLIHDELMRDTFQEGSPGTQQMGPDSSFPRQPENSS